MRYYWLWVLSFFLKATGAALDASYHFKYFFEEYSFPHIVNFMGFLLGLVLLIIEWRNPKHIDRRSLSFTWCGYLIFLIAIPLDFSYHLTFGIDLTTWSPTHFLYYIGTGFMIFGIWRGYVQTGDKKLHSVFAAFFLETLMFPCIQQENGAIAYDQYIHHTSIASKEILELLHNPYSQIYGGAPEWVYPVYVTLTVSLFSWLVFRKLRDMRIVLIGSLLFIAFRYTARIVFALIQYPVSFVPFVIVLIPLFLMVFQRKPLIAALASSSAYFLVLYAVTTSHILVAPPLSLWMILPVWAVALLASLARGERS